MSKALHGLDKIRTAFGIAYTHYVQLGPQIMKDTVKISKSNSGSGSKESRSCSAIGEECLGA